MIRYYNSLILILEIGPEKFRLTFYIRKVESTTHTIVDEWCIGFQQGIALSGDARQPLLDEQPDILPPFKLFATPECWAELDAAANEAAMYAQWSSIIESTVFPIHA